MWHGDTLKFNPLNAKLNPICHLLALLGAHHIFHVSRIRVKTNQILCRFISCVPFPSYLTKLKKIVCVGVCVCVWCVCVCVCDVFFSSHD